ncbi:hypothetical protein [Pseudomonas izuensis]|uniref:hypothetical protein n=1 Tax=Pseudomonas izuensis TaxID=2684212 RepID=UPI00135A9B01|nr:hypothetical protein [Pseudomonas izuensis]
MSPNLEHLLCKPNLSLFPNATFINDHFFWGFECGDGWFDILSHAFSLVSARTDSHPGCGEVAVEEVKEKFGGLRIYYRGGDDYVEGVFSLAESASIHICVICGNRVSDRRVHFHHPRCESITEAEQ